MGYAINSEPHLLPLWINKYQTRTVIFWDAEDEQFYYGDAAIEKFINGHQGRLIQSPKSFLNSQQNIQTAIWGKVFSLEGLISLIVTDYRDQAVKLLDDRSLDSVLVGRPVRFHDDNPELDVLAQERLKSAVLLAWFKNVEFQLEPIAAARTFRMLSDNSRNTRVLVADFWWGTSDFSIVDLKQGDEMEVISNTGAYVAGNAFDYKLSLNFFSKFIGNHSAIKRVGWGELSIPSWPYFMLSDWKRLHSLWERKNMHLLREIEKEAIDKERVARLLEIASNPVLGYKYFWLVEGSKVALSSLESIQGTIDFFKTTSSYSLSRSSFEEIIAEELIKIQTALLEVFSAASITSESVSKILLVWWTGQMPAIRGLLDDIVWVWKIVEGDTFNAVWTWLSMEAEELFR
jgi:hypothetical chaperone protein